MVLDAAFPLLPLLIWLIPTLALVAFILWRKNKAALARAISMESMAQLLGLTFFHKDSFGLAAQLQDFKLFRREKSRWFGKGKVTNLMRGKVGETEVAMFDYCYTVQAGNARKRITQTVFFANDKNWFLPNFCLTPERWWHKIQSKLGVSADINFEENRDFSDKFWLKSDFEDLVRQQFTPALQGFLSEKPPATLEASNYYLIAYKPRHKMQTPEAQLFFQHCCEMVKMLQQEGKMELLNLVELQKEALAVPNTGAQS